MKDDQKRKSRPIVRGSGEDRRQVGQTFKNSKGEDVIIIGNEYVGHTTGGLPKRKERKE